MLKSRIPQIIAKAQRDAETVNAASAERIAQEAQGRAPRDTGELADSIEAKPGEDDEYRVEVGVWYAHFLEFGTSRQGARPFLTPAAEAEREPHRKAISDLYS